MNQRDRTKLQANYQKLTEVMYSSISPHLISTFVIDLDMHGDIDACSTEKRKMEKLLQLLPSRGATALKELVAALKPSYGWLAANLEESTSSSNYDAICSNIQNICNNNLSENITNAGLESFKDMSVSSHEKSIEKMFQASIPLCTNWPMMANAMDLSPCQIADIRRNLVVEGGTSYAIQQLLVCWIAKCGPSKATFARLVQITEKEGINDVTEKLIDYWSTLQQ